MKMDTLKGLCFLSVYGLAISSLRIDGTRGRTYLYMQQIENSVKPNWAGGGIMSDFVNGLISIKPLYGLMKIAARQVLISTAEKNNVAWTSDSKRLATMRPVLESHYASLLSKEVTYPEYYTQSFHAYDEGNLNWDAAFECESATLSMALRVFPKEKLTPEQAQRRIRESFFTVLKDYLPPSKKVSAIADAGCSVGVSTFYLAEAFPEAASIDGIDLSPYFLAVAKHRQSDQLSLNPNINLSRVKWIHANLEDTALPAASYDVITSSFVFHELPINPTVNILKEFRRLLRPGGVVALTDNDPSSPVIRNLPPPIFTLMKSTEPWSDQYYSFNLENALKEAGFGDVKTFATDPRHRTILARVPETL